MNADYLAKWMLSTCVFVQGKGGPVPFPPEIVIRSVHPPQTGTPFWLSFGASSANRNTVLTRPSCPGKLIAVEGLDGSGKSTQLHLVRRWLELEGYRVFFTAWNSSSLVKPSTSKGKTMRSLTPTTFCLIHATDFADRYERQILPLLRAGYIVLCDRYIFTAFARDAVRGVDREWVQQLYGFAAKPDLTLFFRAPLEVSLRRILEGRPELKYHEAGLDMNWSADPYESFRIFQGRTLEEYERMTEPFGFTVINSDRDIHVMQEEVREIVRSKIDLSKYRRGCS